MAEIAVIFISPFLQKFFEKMASREFVDFFRERKLNDRLFRKLKIALLTVNPVLEDAEDRQFTETSVKEWLDEVKDTVYNAEDILDKISTKDLQSKLESELGTITSKVRHSISTSHFVNKIEGEINVALDILEDLAKQIGVLGLRAGVGGNPLERLPTTSLVDESRIYGRHDDKDAIINSLLSDGASGDEMGVIAIVGMAGIGKTTIAQLVYNDNKVKEHFDLKAWVCVSIPFDVFMIMKTILEEVGSPANADSKNLNQLQIKLKETLIGKKFLIILDDVWNTNPAKWDVLSNGFKFGAHGSKVIVTTRNSEVARVMHASATRHIMELPKEDCWLLFTKYAFHDDNSDAYPDLKTIGRQIVEKYKGLPLAIKGIGALLWSKLDVDEWDKVLRSELWDLPIEETCIILALKLSYKYLSSHLKRCFAYCSIFPKGYTFKKEQLILLWMAEGFLPQLKHKTMEEVGDDYFLALVSRSLFQRSNCDAYIMHDLVNDLAKFISKRFTSSHEDDCSREILSKTRHFSNYWENFHINKFGTFTFHESKVRTLLESISLGPLSFFTTNEDVSQFSLPVLKCLRVLILPHHKDKTKLPDSIGKLKLLRYLDLSWSSIKRLPDSICKLCNLQILNLSHCRDLAALPRDMHKLVNLRHLDFAETRIEEMPINLGRLKCLQTLTKFMVSKTNESYITELGKLTNLRGSLPILELQNVESPTNATALSLLSDMKHLKELVLEWKRDTNSSESQIIVLDSLQPHKNLKILAINGYGGKHFPDQIGHASFSNISSLRLRNCNHCCSLPLLGQLPSLQDLSIVGLNKVAIVGREFYGSGSSSLMKPFEALEVLRFENMLKWEKWFSFDAENKGGAFPNLRELYINKCPKLITGLPIHLPSLIKLHIRDCPQMVAPLPRTSSQCKLMLENCNTVILLNKLPTGMQVEIRQFDALMLTIQSCRKLVLPKHLDCSSLKYLTLDSCDSLKAFPLDLFLKIRRLKINGCGNLESLTIREQHEHDLLLSLIHIEINGCPNFVYFPKGGLQAPNLKDFYVINCGSLSSLPDKMHILPFLEKLYIEDCPQVESFPEGGLPSNLNEIYIDNCDKLFVSRMGWGLQKLLRVRRLTIKDESKNVESFPDEGLLPTSLTSLSIWEFPNLKSLDKKGLQHLTALEELKIFDCPKLECMPEDGLPASLSTINIIECPLLKKEWERKEGQEWCKIAHVPNIYIDESFE